MHLNTVQNTAIKNQQFMKVEKQDRLDPEKMTPAQRMTWAATANNCQFWIIKRNEIASRTGVSQKTVQRTYKIKRDQGYMVSIKLRDKCGNFDSMMYITSNVKLSRSKWIESIQDINFDKFIIMCNESKKLTDTQKAKLKIPKLKKASKYTFVYDRDGILQQTTLKSVPTHNKEPEENRLLNEQKLTDKEQHSNSEEITEAEPIKIEKPENTRGLSIGQFGSVPNCLPNIQLNTNKLTKKTPQKTIEEEEPAPAQKIINLFDPLKSHDKHIDTQPEKPQEKLIKSAKQEKIPSNFDYYEDLKRELVNQEHIPAKFFYDSLRACIAHNLETPPFAKPPCWLDWAKDWITRGWSAKSANLARKAEKQAQQAESKYLQAAGIEPEKRLTKQFPITEGTLKTFVYNEHPNIDKTRYLEILEKVKIEYIERGTIHHDWTGVLIDDALDRYFKDV